MAQESPQPCEDASEVVADSGKDGVGGIAGAAYVTREEGAAELRVSPSTWDEMVEAGLLPPPKKLGVTGKILRWRWADVDRALSLHGAESIECELAPEPYFRRLADGQTQGRKRVAS